MGKKRLPAWWPVDETFRQFKDRKRREARAVEKAAHDLLLGCAMSNLRDGEISQLLNTARDIRRKLSRASWGR
jgi:hypothetical protein